MATVYYNFSTGNDTTGNGSLATPYKTLHKAGTVAVAGDTIDGSSVASTELYPADEIDDVNFAHVILSPSGVNNDTLTFAALNQSTIYSGITINDTRTGVTGNVLAIGAFNNAVATISSFNITSNTTGFGASGSALYFAIESGAPYVITDLNVETDTGGAVWFEDGAESIINIGTVIGYHHAIAGTLGHSTGDQSPATVVIQNGVLDAQGSPILGFATLDVSGGFISTLTLDSMDISTEYVGSASHIAQMVNLSPDGLAAVNINNTNFSGFGGGADIIRFPGTSTHSPLTVAVAITGFTLMDGGSTGLVGNALFRVVKDHITVTGIIAQTNADITAVTSNGGTINMTDLTMVFIGTNSMRGGKMAGIVILRGTGTFDSTAAAMDLSDSVVHLYHNTTITKVGSNAVTDNANTRYYTHGAVSLTATGWTPLGVTRPASTSTYSGPAVQLATTALFCELALKDEF